MIVRYPISPRPHIKCSTLAWAALLLLASTWTHAYYLPGLSAQHNSTAITSPNAQEHIHKSSDTEKNCKVGGALHTCDVTQHHPTAEVNSLTSAEAELPYDYYSMPFCRPEDGVQKAARSVNPGTILMGLRIENSPYTFFMMIDEKTKVVCRAEGQKGSYGKLTKDEATEFQEKIRDAYNVRLILDNLPVTTYDLQRGPESVRPGFELGFVADNKYYVNNHLIFKILVHATNGQYTRMKEEMEQLEAAAVVEVRV